MKYTKDIYNYIIDLTFWIVTIDIEILQVDKAFTASCESKVTPLTIAVFLKYSSGKFFKIF
jgi:hypothetical protein